MSEELPARRTACDRCRSHKLRCERSDRSDEIVNECRRCLKAGAICKTSAAGKSGRPIRAFRRRYEQQQQQQQQTKGGTVDSGTAGTDTQMDATGLEGVQLLTPSSIMLEEQSASSQNLIVSENEGATNGSIGFIHGPRQSEVNNLACSENFILESMDMSFDLQQLLGSTSSNSQAISSNIESSASTLLPPPPPLDEREECTKKLADLHSDLVADLDMVRESKTADQCTSIATMPEFSQSYNFLIGRMLGCSMKLLDILRHFVPESTSQEKQKEPLRCEVPTLLSILTCYIYLVRIYRITFVSIHESLFNSLTPPTKLPIFPGLQLGGFSLEPHINVQVQILVQVSQKMLSKIDEALGVPRGMAGGLLRNAGLSTDILDSMLEAEATEQSRYGVLATNNMSLKDMWADLNKL